MSTVRAPTSANNARPLHAGFLRVNHQARALRGAGSVSPPFVRTRSDYAQTVLCGTVSVFTARDRGRRTLKKSDSKRQAILDTAYRLFRTQGFDKTSVSEITAEVGGSKATIYNHFPSKEELFVECMLAAAKNYMAGNPQAPRGRQHRSCPRPIRLWQELP